jgi:hypothetical protein
MSANSTVASRRSSAGADGSSAAREVPQLAQNLAPAVFVAPQEGQARASEVPQPVQNRASPALSWPQVGQV